MILDIKKSQSPQMEADSKVGQQAINAYVHDLMALIFIEFH